MLELSSAPPPQLGLNGVLFGLSLDTGRDAAGAGDDGVAAMVTVVEEEGTVDDNDEDGGGEDEGTNVAAEPLGVHSLAPACAANEVLLGALVGAMEDCAGDCVAATVEATAATWELELTSC